MKRFLILTMALVVLQGARSEGRRAATGVQHSGRMRYEVEGEIRAGELLGAMEGDIRAGEPLGAVRTITCDFVQTKYLKMLNMEMVSKGSMWYASSDRLRWEYTTPYRYTLIVQGTRCVVDKAATGSQHRGRCTNIEAGGTNNEAGGTRNEAGGTRKVIDLKSNKTMKAIAETMMSAVSGTGILSDKRFRCSVVETGGESVATLVPEIREMKQMFERIVVHFSGRPAIVTKVELSERNGDRTVIEFKKTRINEPISGSIFNID